MTGKEDLGEKLMFGSGQDGKERFRDETTSLLHGISFNDLEQLLTCEKFNPDIFTNYLYLINMVHNLEEDCVKTFSTFYPEGNRNEKLPVWIK